MTFNKGYVVDTKDSIGKPTQAFSWQNAAASVTPTKVEDKGSTFSRQGSRGKETTVAVSSPVGGSGFKKNAIGKSTLGMKINVNNSPTFKEAISKFPNLAIIAGISSLEI